MGLAAALPVKIVSPPPGPSTAEWITAWATVFIALGVIVAIAGVALERRHRHAEAAARFSERWNSKELTDVRVKIRKNPETTDLRSAVLTAYSDDPPLFYEYLLELNFFEELAVLEKHHGVSVQLVNSLMGSIICDRWKMWSLTVVELRKVTGHKSHFEHFQKLAGVLEARPTKWVLFRRWCARLIEG